MFVRGSTSKETKDTSVSLDEQFTNVFSWLLSSPWS